MRSVEVVVAGGGPAGAAAAIALARAGRGVLLCEAGDGSERKVGEALPPGAAPLLRDLGVRSRLGDDGHLPSFGNVATWGDREPYPVDFVYDPNGHGWHLDRVRFEALLRDVARAAGAEVVVGAAVRLEAGPSPWGLRVGEEEVEARAFVDATGRRAALARVLGARRVRLDRLVAVHAVVAADPGDADARTRVVGGEAGWWYASLVPGGRRVVAWLTDADLADPALRTREGFAAALPHSGLAGALAGSAAALPGSWLAGGRPEVLEGPFTTAAHAAHLTAAAGEGWAAAGDAAVAADPLSSQGLVTALYTGMAAGRAAGAWLGGDGAALEGYARRVDAVAKSAEHNRRQAYAFEDRWPASPFWARRRG